MKPLKSFQPKNAVLLPVVLTLLAAAALGLWFFSPARRTLSLRVPGTDQAPGTEYGPSTNPVLAGKLIRADGQPADLPGAWPHFRGPDGTAISPETIPLARTWQAGEPRELWAVDVGEGYAGAAVLRGRVYLMDYDQEKKQDALRCLSLADGREIWRYVYRDPVKRNHGMSRTVPAASDKLVVGMGPKCHVVCLDSQTGELRWGIDLVRQFKATVPPWYAGQCPLLDNGCVLLAPGGPDALLLAVEAETGKIRWQSPNPHGWKMTHSSIMPLQFEGERMYVYCANSGVVAVSARDGSILWETTDWKISIATVPSPLVLEGGKIFFSGGYDAGSLMIQLRKEAGRLRAEPVFRLDAKVFGATQQTPVLCGRHIYGVRPDGRFVCLDTGGKTVWASDAGASFGLGPFLMADGLFFAMNDSGLLRLIEATPEKYRPLAQAQVLKGRESWAPLALAGGRLLARDFTKLVCLDVSRH